MQELYFNKIEAILQKIKKTQSETINTIADKLSDVVIMAVLCIPLVPAILTCLVKRLRLERGGFSRYVRFSNRN